ncbi:Putative odorant receptor 85d [Trachymyrmex septentrionalis]|uniref:Putative odorant receptor 85d n=1 Tax=Trachymyrmex septentrionalis TaxID=34720 RepID=A0A151K139_9HYME|nr:Putative odorant receptor 85d [Trachymyrmex septentrionalis]
MEHPKEHYYKFNRFLLSVSGLWPYQSKRSAHLTRAVIIVFMLSSTFFQISSMFTSKVTLDYIVDGIPSLLLALGSLSNLYSRIIHIDKLLSLFISNITANFIIDMIPAFIPVMGSLSQMYARVGHVDKLRNLFEHMWNDWRLRKTNYETKIMQKHAETSKLLTLYYLLMQYVAATGYNAWLFLPDILDIISPINESRPRILPFKAEFFIDQGQYFNLIRSHICIVIFIISLILVTVSTLYVVLTQHVCGMCELLGNYRISAYDESCINAVMRSISVSIPTLIILFVSNYMGQRVTDASSNACEKVYNSVWYSASASEQKLLLLIMKRRFHPLILTACKFYVMSLQNFGMLLTFSTNNITTDFIIDVMSEFIPTAAGMGHIYARIKHIDKLRDLFECIRDDWKLQKTSFEIKIMHKYAETSRLFSLYYLIFYIVMITCNLQMFLPYILDVILPMNESRPRTQPFLLEFFTIEEQYPTLINFYVFIMIIITTIIFCANSILCVTLTQHACGMCELLGFIGTIEIYHTVPFLMDIIELIIVLSFVLTQILTIGGDIDRAFRCISLAMIALIYIFISNYMAQKVTDMSLNVCEKVYNSAWYNANVSEQKPLLLIMKRRFRPFVLTACRFYVMSLQNFGMILQTAISYCMFMRQL